MSNSPTPGWRAGGAKQGALYLQVAKGDGDGAAQVASGRVGHHHRHDSGVQLQVRRYAVPLVAAQLLQGLIAGGGGGGEVGVAQQSSVGEACTEKTWLETAGWGEMGRWVKEEAEHEKVTEKEKVEREVEEKRRRRRRPRSREW